MPLPVADEGIMWFPQRSKNRRISVSPHGFSGTARWIFCSQSGKQAMPATWANLLIPFGVDKRCFFSVRADKLLKEKALENPQNKRKNRPEASLREGFCLLCTNSPKMAAVFSPLSQLYGTGKGDKIILI